MSQEHASSSDQINYIAFQRDRERERENENE